MLFIHSLRTLKPLLLPVLMTLLSGCFGGAKVQKEVVIDSETEIKEVKSTSVDKPTEINTVTKPSKRLSKAELTNQLLYEAQVALAKDQLTTPVHENALDKYRAALIIDPSNLEAKKGIEQVVSRYCQLARQATDAYHFDQATTFLQRARQILPNSSVIKETQNYLAKTKQTANTVETIEDTDVVISRDNEIDLPRKSLKKRSEILSQQLAELAQKVMKSDQFVLIVTPTDAEGRWVYAQMKQALPGYRLRGDIKLGKDPKIILQAPIN